MNRILVLPALLLALYLPLAFADYAQSASPAPVEMRAALDAQLRANAQNHGIPAQAVLVLHNGEILYRNAAGTTGIEGGTPVTPKSVFPIFSVSKLFASTIAMQLVEEGKLDLAAPASRYVSNLPPSWRDIRVEQFLSHVSGVPEYYDGSDFSRPFPPSLDAVFAKLSHVPHLSLPGERTRYTQTNYLVIEAILEAVTQTPYRTLVTRRIIERLGLNETWLDVADQHPKVAEPAGRLIGNLEHGRFRGIASELTLLDRPAIHVAQYASETSQIFD